MIKLNLKMCMRRILKLFSVLLGFVLLLSLTGCDYEMTGILNPKGVIAFEERQLLFDALALMLIVVIPVIIMSLAFVVRYRASHKTADYKPNWSHNFFIEAIWWGVPCAIIIVLGIMTWKRTHDLDPYRPITTTGKTLQINAVALPWKWLFIYPEEKIATINYLVLPKGRQVEFWLTTDHVPMSSFFIPQLGSQIYTMAGMRTRLHLIATSLGTYKGLNNQFNGEGFSDMVFQVKVVEDAELQQWVNKVKQSPKHITSENYADLQKPTIAAPVEYFSQVEQGLFMKIMEYYMKYKGSNKEGAMDMTAMEMAPSEMDSMETKVKK